MKHLWVASLFLCLSASAADDLVVESSDIQSESRRPMKVKIGTVAYFGSWMKFFSYEEKYTPIIFSAESRDFHPQIRIRHTLISNTTKRRLRFYCVLPLSGISDIKLERMAIYLLGPKKRQVVKIGSFSPNDNEKQIIEKAKAALKKDLEDGGGKRDKK